MRKSARPKPTTPAPPAIPSPSPLSRGWFLVHPSWIAGLWQLKATGRARVNPTTSMLEIEVEDVHIPADGAMLRGRVSYSIAATGWDVVP